MERLVVIGAWLVGYVWVSAVRAMIMVMKKWREDLFIRFILIFL